ncbi:MAG: PilW family protein, partial [Pseudomonadales bacterium]|nr:PilW family protein [Pseudomonadales bacterium]
LTGNLAPNNANIQVKAPNSCGFAQDSILMISDCEAADIFRVVNNPTTGGTIQTVTHSQGSNNANVLSKLYQSDADVFSFTSSSYFIRNNPAGVPSLYVKDHALDTAAFELIEGVENLQVAYGVDDTNDGVPERYIAANTVQSASLWKRVVAVRLRILMRTTDKVQARDFVDTDTTFSSFGAAAYTGGFMRKVFTTTIQLRNRALAL